MRPHLIEGGVGRESFATMVFIVCVTDCIYVLGLCGFCEQLTVCSGRHDHANFSTLINQHLKISRLLQPLEVARWAGDEVIEGVLSGLVHGCIILKQCMENNSTLSGMCGVVLIY